MKLERNQILYDKTNHIFDLKSEKHFNKIEAAIKSLTRPTYAHSERSKIVKSISLVESPVLFKNTVTTTSSEISRHNHRFSFTRKPQFQHLSEKLRLFTTETQNQDATKIQSIKRVKRRSIKTFSQSVPNIICKRRGSESSDDKPEKIVPNDVGVASMHEKI